MLLAVAPTPRPQKHPSLPATGVPFGLMGIVMLNWWSQRDGLSPVLSWSILLGAPLLGGVVGARHAWRWAWLGLAASAGFLAASRIAPNDTLAGSEDMSWRILLVIAAILAPLLFYAAMLTATVFRWLLSTLRPHAHP